MAERYSVEAFYLYFLMYNFLIIIWEDFYVRVELRCGLSEGTC